MTTPENASIARRPFYGEERSGRSEAGGAKRRPKLGCVGKFKVAAAEALSLRNIASADKLRLTFLVPGPFIIFSVVRYLTFSSRTCILLTSSSDFPLRMLRGSSPKSPGWELGERTKSENWLG